MSRFAASFTPTNYSALDPPGDYDLSGNVVDNNGIYTGMDLQVGDVVYINTSGNGGPLMAKYIVLSIVDNTNNLPTVECTVRQIVPDMANGTNDPWGVEGLVGRPDLVGVVQLLDWSVSSISSAFIMAIQNYQTDLSNASLLTICNNIIAPIQAGSNRKFNTPYTGNLDGANTIFVCSSNFLVGSSAVFFNGQKLTLNKDYTEQLPNTINLLFTPSSDDVLTIDISV